MALILDKELRSGIKVEGAYCKVNSISNLDKELMVINIEYKKDSKSTAFFTERKSISYDLDKGNPIAQAYMYLKNQEGFESSINC